MTPGVHVLSAFADTSSFVLWRYLERSHIYLVPGTSWRFRGIVESLSAVLLWLAGKTCHV